MTSPRDIAALIDAGVCASTPSRNPNGGKARATPGIRRLAAQLGCWPCRLCMGQRAA